MTISNNAFFPNLWENATHSMRVAYLESFPAASLSQDEILELNFQILMEKCLIPYYQTDLSSEMARLMQHPYSPLSVVYKQLATICYENYLLTHQDDLNQERRDQLLRAIDDALSLFSSRHIPDQEAKKRCENAASSLKETIEKQRRCPLLHYACRSIESGVTAIENSCLEKVEVIYLTITCRTVPRSRSFKFACTTNNEHTCTFVNERIVNLWNRHFERFKSIPEIDYSFDLHCHTATNCYKAQYIASFCPNQ